MASTQHAALHQQAQIQTAGRRREGCRRYICRKIHGGPRQLVLISEAQCDNAPVVASWLCVGPACQMSVRMTSLLASTFQSEDVEAVSEHTARVTSFASLVGV